MLIALIVKPFSNKSKSPSTGGTSSKLSTADGIEIINNGSPQNGTPVAPLPTKTDTDQKNSNTTAVLLSKNETMPIQTELVKSAGPTKEDSKQAILPEKSQEQKTPGKPQTEEVAATPAKPKEDNPVKKTEPSPPAGEDKENNTYYNKLKNINASLEKVKSDFSKLEKDSVDFQV